MEFGIVFKFLHISTMITAVTLALGPSLVFDRLAASGDVLATRAFLARMAVFDRFIGALFVLGALFGLLAATAIGFNLLAPWLVIAYLIFVSVMVLQVTVGRRWRGSLAHTVSAVPAGTAHSTELAIIGSAAAGKLLYWYTAAATAVIVFDMVAKPLS